MVNYLEGAEHCKTNSERLETSARILLQNDDGTDSFGLFLYYIAYEEIAKAIFCLFVHRGWLQEDFVNPVFTDHRTKLFLYEEIFRSLAFSAGEPFLGGARLGDISFDEFINQHRAAIMEHRKRTKDFLYVGKKEDWEVPQVEISNVRELEKEIKAKIVALNIIYEFVKGNTDENASVVNNFRFFENDDGTFTVRYDAI